MARFLFGLVLLTLSACKSEAPAPPPALLGVLASYEELRAGLARDQSVSAAAAKTRGEAEAAGAAVPAHKAKLEAVARAAGELERVAAADLATQRVKFGEVSRAVIALGQAEPGLQRGRFVYECPMARGYRKWVQATAGLENPYMGKSMLECGAESSWAP